MNISNTQALWWCPGCKVTQQWDIGVSSSWLMLSIEFVWESAIAPQYQCYPNVTKMMMNNRATKLVINALVVRQIDNLRGLDVASRLSVDGTISAYENLQDLIGMTLPWICQLVSPWIWWSQCVVCIYIYIHIQVQYCIYIYIVCVCV